jgi:hypothetical protein
MKTKRQHAQFPMITVEHEIRLGDQQHVVKLTDPAGHMHLVQMPLVETKEDGRTLRLELVQLDEQVNLMARLLEDRYHLALEIAHDHGHDVTSFPVAPGTIHPSERARPKEAPKSNQVRIRMARPSELASLQTELGKYPLQEQVDLRQATVF